jgi:hypothetical protein
MLYSSISICKRTSAILRGKEVGSLEIEELGLAGVESKLGVALELLEGALGA